jgi:hypothetical protein
MIKHHGAKIPAKLRSPFLISLFWVCGALMLDGLCLNRTLDKANPGFVGSIGSEPARRPMQLCMAFQATWTRSD